MAHLGHFGLLACCVVAGVGRLAAQQRDTTEVQVAAIRWAFDSVIDQQSSHYAVICVGHFDASIPNAQPGTRRAILDFNATAMASLPRGGKRIVPRSECTNVGATAERTTHRSTSDLALAIVTGVPRFVLPDRATVFLQIRNGFGQGFECTVTRTDSAWRALGCRLTTTS